MTLNNAFRLARTPFEDMRPIIREVTEQIENVLPIITVTNRPYTDFHRPVSESLQEFGILNM